jgi:hypothetical protein
MKPHEPEQKTRRASPHDLSTVDLLKEIAVQSQNLVKAQVALAKAELRADLAAEKKMAGSLGVAAVAALTGINMLLVAAILALATRIPGWLAALIVSGIVLLGGGLAAGLGWQKRVRRPLSTSRDEVREDVKWTKEKLA